MYSRIYNSSVVGLLLLILFCSIQSVEVLANNPPVFTPGISGVVPGSIDRVGAGTVNFSSTFTDADDPGVAAFFITVKLRAQYSQSVITVADNLADGAGGMTVTNIGGGSYTADINYDPPDNLTLGYYDIYFSVYDGADSDTDYFDDNIDELLITNGGENGPPIVASDEATASPAGIERIGANVSTISATFTDPDVPGVVAFTVNFKIRLPDNSSEIILATNAGNGAQGVTISDDGGGIYTASVSWDPPDAQQLGFYDIYFDVSDGAATSIDGYENNLDEIEIYDAISNKPPTLTAGNTYVLPIDVNRLGSDFTIIVGSFSDLDMPGTGAFIVTIKVRDQSAVEYTIVNAANHGQQDLRIVHLTGENYEASVGWNPPDGQVIGTYDLYMSVEDNNGAVVADGYVDNADELTVSSAALLGDGYILRRTHNADNCGGPASACHNLVDHQSQDCLVCHTPHSTTNIYLVRDSIQTPNSGKMQVIFKTLGIGDPYNDPDPIVGDPTSGVMADSTDNVFTGVCEVCHTATVHHRNDGSQPGANHNDAIDCTSCHPHSGGFASGESGGGSSCSCHSAIFTAMDSTSTTEHHVLANDDPDYSPGASGMYATKNCLTCHVDHDIFRPDLNTGIGQRAKNLRVDWAIDPVQGDNTVLANSDYSSTGSGGICLSCHADATCNGCHSAHKIQTVHSPKATASSFTHTFQTKSDYDAATSAHNYSVPSTFSTDGSTFNANCLKCHNGSMSKNYQNSTFKFSLHSSDFSKMLDSTGITSPTEPLEEEFCFKCHSMTSNPNAGAGLDFYGVKSMTNQSALDIEAAFSRTYTHPTLTYSGRHSQVDSALTLADGNRHAECQDCHNVHVAQQGTHDGSSSLVSNALKGVWGVEPTSWPAAPVPTDNGNVFVAPSAYTKVNPALKEYQICLKCHSNYTTLPTGSRNLAEEINPNYPSTHGITIANQNSYCNTTTMFEPWGSSGSTYCSDCHRSSNAGDPEGPHGSNTEHLLVATIVSDDIVGTPLCDVCHKATTYWSGDAAASKFADHPSSKGAHQRSKGCFACHMWDFAISASVGVPNQSEVFTDGELFVHGQNKKWVYNDEDGSAGSGQPVDAFCNGYLADVDYTNRRCWSDNGSGCNKSHSDKGY